MTRTISLLALLLLSVARLAAAPPVSAEDVAFATPEAQATLRTPVTFTTMLDAPAQPAAVELLIRAPGERSVSVLPAEVVAAGDGWRASAEFEGHVPPNTRFDYRFRARGSDGHVTLGPEAQATVEDERFAWRTIEGGVIRLHWYSGDEGFAQRALQIGEEAVASASELLGVQESEPIDFFIYDSEAALREALGPGTRENVGGQAHADIRTLFGLIEPAEINSAWVDTLVAHELTHLVFDTATDNPYHAPPRWLNEGVAVYLSEGYSPSWRSAVDEAAGRGSIIPLDGLGGLFPTTALEFRLAYAESVSAVDFFIRTYDEQTLWELVRSYAEGVSDDEAFEAATGADLAVFNAAWMNSLGLDVPQPLGPRRGPPGPLPPGWEAVDGPSEPATPPAATPGAPRPAPVTPAPGTPEPVDGSSESVLVGLGVGLAVVFGIVVLGLLARRRLLT